MLRRKYLLVRILIYLGSGWIFCTKCNFLLPLRQLIFRQKQPGHWAEVVCHFHLPFNAPTDTYFSFSHFSFLIFLHKAIPVSKSSIICKFLIYKTFIVFVKASWTKDSKGVVVLTIPSFGELPKNFFQIFQTSNHIFRKKFGGVRKILYLCRSKTSKDTTNMNALLWILVIALASWEDRSVLFWLLVAWITKPVVVIILLLLIGKSE